MDPLILFPYWFILVLLLLNAIAVRYIKIEMEDRNDSKQEHD